MTVNLTSLSSPHRHDVRVRSPGTTFFSSPRQCVSSVRQEERCPVDTVRSPHSFLYSDKQRRNRRPLVHVHGRFRKDNRNPRGGVSFVSVTDFANPPPSHRHDPRVRSSGTGHSLSSPFLRVPFVKAKESYVVDVTRPPEHCQKSDKRGRGRTLFVSVPGTVTVSVTLKTESLCLSTLVDLRSRHHPTDTTPGPATGNGPLHVVYTPDFRQVRNRDTCVGDRIPVHFPSLKGTTVPMSSTTVPRVPRFRVP